MEIIIDADSMIYASCYQDSFEDAKLRLDSFINEAIQDLSLYNWNTFRVCSGSNGNFRNHIVDYYKSNRRGDKPEYLNELRDYCKKEWMSVYKHGVETDDVVASLWASAVAKGVDAIIVSIDKDYKQFPAKIYNYIKKEMIIVNDTEALYNFYTQMIVGDSADNIKGIPRKGVKAAEKTLYGLESKYSMVKAVYNMYIDKYKGKAKIKYMENYMLLKLKTDVFR